MSMLLGVISENFLKMNGVWLERADQTKIETAGVRKEILQFPWRVHRWQPILSALLGRFDRDLLPLGFLLLCFFRIKIDNRAFGNQRRDFRSPDLHRLLHDQIHVFSFWNCLSERDTATQWRRFSLVYPAKLNFVAGKIA